MARRDQQQMAVYVTVLLFFFGVVSAQKTLGYDSVPSYDKCQVLEKVPCGVSSISGTDCEAIHCCFDGQLCYYGNSVTVQCSRDGQFVVVVAKDSTVPHLDLDSLALLGGKDAPCRPAAVTDAFAIYNFPVTACGTTITVEGDFLVYENRMTSAFEIGVGPSGSITRDAIYELLFQCRYLGSEIAPLVAEVNTVAQPLPVAAPGPLRVELRLANGECSTQGCIEGEHAFTSYYQESDYPVTKVLQQPVYVEVRILERTDPNIVLLLETCWATSSPDPHSLPQWNLLANGCPYQGDKYLTNVVSVDGSSGLPFPNHYKRFIVRMFTFVDSDTMEYLQEKVFIHCSIAVCHRSAKEGCEQRCFRKGRDVSGLQKAPGQDKTMVSSGELIIMADPPAPARMQSEVPSSLGYGVLGMAVLATMVVFGMVLAIIWRSRRQ